MEIKFNVPGNIFKDNNEFAGKKLRLYAALMFVFSKEMSFEKARLLSGLEKNDFINYCKQFGIQYNLYQNENNSDLKLEEKQITYSKNIINRTKTIQTIKTYFSKHAKILRVWVFGSFARQENDRNSDIDLMLEVDKKSKFTLLDLAEIKFQLEQITPLPIDLVMKNALKENVKKRILKDLTLIYEK